MATAGRAGVMGVELLPGGVGNQGDSKRPFRGGELDRGLFTAGIFTAGRKRASPLAQGSRLRMKDAGLVYSFLRNFCLASSERPLFASHSTAASWSRRK